MSNDKESLSCDTFAVRRCEARDRDAVLTLLPPDVMDSQLSRKSIHVPINSIDAVFVGKHHVWVAEAFGRIIGSVTVIRNNDSLAHLTCMCIAPGFAEGTLVARRLAEKAIRDAWDRGYIKLVVHTRLPPNRLAAELHELGFEFSRETSKGGEHMLEFYQNLYERPRS